MQRICRFALLAALIALVSCAKDVPRRAAKDSKDKDVRKVALDGDIKLPIKNGEDGKTPLIDTVVPSLPALTRDELYEASLHEAIDYLADRKYPEALKSLEAAQKYRDTGTVQREIDKVRAGLAQQTGAEKAVQDVKTVLDEGKADDAAKLAAQALEQYGGGDKGTDLAKLKQQAEAVVTAVVDDSDTRHATLKAEAARLAKAENLRAAAVALDQAVSLKADAVLAEQLVEVRDRLKTYDDNRRLASGLRKEPARLEEGLTYLRKAQKSWDTVEVRHDIDEYTLILERRRERVAVTDFEVRGDVGIVAAGRTLAEELLPHFKPRFDVVERSHLNKVIDELKLEGSDLVDNAAARREVGRISRVRYLVVGSITPLAGITLNARLVEVGTGLIVQTARVSAPTLDDLLPKLKQVALELQMSDEQKLAFEAKLSAQAVKTVVVKPIESEPVYKYDPVPEVQAVEVKPPPPIVTYTPAPPPLGNVTITDFAPRPVVVVHQPPPPVTLIIEGERKHRLLRLSLELGDNLFRRRRYAEAQRHFSLALTLAGPRREVVARVDTCRRLIPPPPPLILVRPQPVQVIVGAPRPVVVVAAPRPRHRLAVFGFYCGGDPGLVPAAMGDWAADTIAPYMGTNFELIERGEVCWYMGRLGITMRDLLRDSGARLSLARALNARFFVFGTIQPTASYNVATHLMDAETGDRTATGEIHVKDQSELKVRMSELVGQMGVKPDEQKQLVKQSQTDEKALGDARKLLATDPKQAAEVARTALKTSPRNLALANLLEEAQRKEKATAFEAQRREQAKQQQAAAEAAKKRQEDLTAQSLLARQRAEKEAAARSDGAKKQQQAQRESAAENLRTQAKQAMTKGDPGRAVSLLESAVSLKASEDAYRELATAKAARDKARADATAVEKKKRDDAQDAQRKSALARIEAEKKTREVADTERRKAQETRDLAMHDALMKQAQGLFAKKEYAQAIATAQSARRAKATEDSAKLIRQAQDAIALVEAEKKGAEEKKRLLAEQKARADAEAQTKQKQKDYSDALESGRKLLESKKYDAAIAQYQSARKLFETDAALNGLRAAEQLRKSEQDALIAQKAAKDAEAKKGQQIVDLLGQGKKALEAKQYPKALEAYRQVGKLSPGNVEALAGLSRAEREQSDENAKLVRAKQEAERKKAFDGLLTAAKGALAKNNKVGAASQVREALKLYPDNAEAKSLLAKAEAGTPVDDDYKLTMSAGADAMKKKSYQGAINSYAEALRKKPNDAAAKSALSEAQRLLKAEQDAARAATSEAAYKNAMTQARSAMDAKKYAEAVKLYDTALMHKPGDPAGSAGKRAAFAALVPKPDSKAIAYQAAMKTAQAAMDAKKYVEAMKAYDSALQSKPGDATATAGKKAAQDALTPKPDPKEEAYQSSMKQAKAAMDAKRYADAAKSYAAALAQKPNDPIALAGRKTAQDALTPKPDPKEVAYQTAMRQAKAAIDAKRYADAVKAYDAALQSKPGDASATAGKKAAVDAQKPKEPSAEDLFQRAMNAGGAALQKGSHQAAINSYTVALKYKPADARAKAGLTEAQRLLKAEQDKAKEAAYQAVMRQAKAAFDGKKHAEAIKQYDAALQLKPGDAAALAGKKSATEALTPPKPDPKAEEKKREAAYQLLMQQGKAALDGKKYADAVRAYDEALKLKPGDAEGIKGKRAATEALNPKTKVDPRAEFNRVVGLAQALEKQKKYSDAGITYQAALKWATDLGDKASQAQAYLGIARNEHVNGHYAAAVKAYEEVLKRSPNDAEAKAALPRAKANKP